MDNATTHATSMKLWVVEGNLDIPVSFRSDRDATVSCMYVSLGGDDPDGFVQMRPLDHKRASNSVFWSLREPVEYECRALVRAPEAPFALMRGKELYEHVADRLTVLTGYPVRVLAVGYTYDEDALRQCIAGKILEYSATTGGEECFRTEVPKNGHFQRLLIPPKSALEAIRWFRHGMTATRRVDQYLSYYIALESIAKHVPGVKRGPRPSDGDEKSGLETQENAAIRYLLSRHPSMPANAKKTLATIRARIAHGNADLRTLQLASANLPAVQRLAADGIALVCGLDPSLFNVLAPSPIAFIAPLAMAQYSAENNPANRWGGLLTDAFAVYLEKARHLAEPELP